MSRLTPEAIRASQTELPPIAAVITELRRQDPYIQQEQHRYRSPRGFQSWPNHLAYAALIEAGLQVMDKLDDPIGFWAATTCRWARSVEAPSRFLAPELAEAFRRTPSPRLDEDFPQVLPCFRLMLPDGALFTEDRVPIPVVIVADLRVMADWLPPQAQRIGGISCVGLALDGTSYLTRHSFQQIGERHPTAGDLSHPAWQWDEQAVQSTNQRKEGLAINALLVQLYQPELLSTGPAAKVRSGKGLSVGGAEESGAVRPQGPVWIGKDFRLDRTPRAPSAGTAAGTSSSTPAPLATGPLAHRAAWREASEPADAVVPAGVRGAELSTSTRTRPTPQRRKPGGDAAGQQPQSTCTLA
ncbi:hypothetical protein KBZ14_08080 [Synechococcus sp. HJ21-Hayes]|uniref:hypothetical protein n=1 Tax=Synechococcus sp. HJ21-Hayes TaxID=2823736 RepID=UPI0020CEDF4A|nr:hypothetical protein [Synechococcus sp. HJ21-Hayes]MCP9852829.1 hypothetical protein [Synechococcus sp. HJ21-Hayes]